MMNPRFQPIHLRCLVWCGFALSLAASAAKPPRPVFQIQADLPTSHSQHQSLGPLQDTTIDESSGLALSLQNPGICWTHNDSGGKPVLYAIDQEGRTVATLHIDGAKNTDWEDLASGPNDQGQPTLFIADIGDNLRRRSQVQVYEVPEPKLPPRTTTGPTPLSAKPSRTWQIRYPDGAADAEGLVVHPKTGQIHIVTKSLVGRSSIYAFPAKPTDAGVTELIPVANLIFPPLPAPGKRSPFNVMTTGADLSPDGRRLVISTYCSLYEWQVDDHGITAATFTKAPIRLSLPELRQIEAVCYDRDSKTLLITSEQLPADFYKVVRPAR